MYDLNKIKVFESFLDNLPIMSLVDEFDIELDIKGRCSCLLNEETRPSMFIDYAKNKWHCFSCQHGGGPAKLVGDFYQQNHGAKNYFNALSKYLDKHIEFREELGFLDLFENSATFSDCSFNSLKKQFEKLEHKPTLSLIKIKEKPKIGSDISTILNYVTELQNGGKYNAQ